jgi:hypothetical protein
MCYSVDGNTYLNWSTRVLVGGEKTVSHEWPLLDSPVFCKIMTRYLLFQIRIERVFRFLLFIAILTVCSGILVFAPQLPMPPRAEELVVTAFSNLGMVPRCVV